MKKLMIAAAIVCAAVATQASVVNWSTSAVPNFFNTGALSGNGNYTASTPVMKASGYTFSYVLAVTDSLGQEVGSGSGTVAMNFANKIATNGITIGNDTAIAAGQTYNYVITISTSLSKLGKGEDWDYTAASASAVLTGTFTGASGVSGLASGTPSSWSVSGATPVEPPEPTPEPTSALLMLVGVAGLALRRRRA